MPGFSAHARTQIHNLFFGTGATPAPPANAYVALHTGDPDSGGAEISGNSYGRVQVPRGLVSWDLDGTETVRNATAITFAAPSPAPHPTTTHFALWDAASGGNLIASGPLTVPRSWQVGVAQTFNPGDLAVTIRSAV